VYHDNGDNDLVSLIRERREKRGHVLGMWRSVLMIGDGDTVYAAGAV
jgi:hypothetical protein